MNKKEIKKWEGLELEQLSPMIEELKNTLEKPSLIILKGDLGAGKTTFVQRFDNNDELLSPTYSLIQEYDTFAHADLYRLEEPEELIHLEIDYYLEDKDYFFVEWGLKYVDNLVELVETEFKKHYLFEIGLGQNDTRNYILSEILS